jgi:hypothetical protein
MADVSDLDPLTREVLALLKRSVDDQAAANRDTARYVLQAEKAAVVRDAKTVQWLGEIKGELGKIREALSDVDKGLDVVATATAQTSAAAKAAAKKPGLFAQITGYMDKNPALKSAVLGTLIQLLGLVGVAAAAYGTFHLAGVPSTPTPVQVAPPYSTAMQPSSEPSP